MTALLRVIVCGTTFGNVYLQGIARLPAHYRLVGILGRGSEHSEACARYWNVPLYRNLEELPEVDLACVAVRSAVVGGNGTELAKALLARGISVVQEHPVHHDEVVDCLRLARQHGVLYRLNPFYSDLAPVRSFIDAARHVLSQREAVYIDAACSVHVLFPLVEMLGQALGGLRPWAFNLQAATVGPFVSISGELAGVPLHLRVQNQMHPGDPDNHTQLLHRIVLGTTGGTLSLTDTHASVLWSPRAHVQRNALGVLEMDGDSPALDLAVSSLIGHPQPPTLRQVFSELWPESIAHALLRVHASIGHPNDSALAQFQLSACKAWQQLGAVLGPAQAIHPEAPVPLAMHAWVAPERNLPRAQ
ncbi:Gfo/Idh/MocA family oxidoreductase [Pseudomonas sp. SDO524_S393]